MSTQLRPEMIRTRHGEFARLVDRHARHEPRGTAGRQRFSARQRLRQAVVLAAAVTITGLCLAFATAGASGATAGPRSAHARQLQTKMHRLAFEGYVPRACTSRGLQMFNPRTGRVATVRY